jgi:hypothetical protein
MKIIECLNDKISEELSDSESYANPCYNNYGCGGCNGCNGCGCN